MPRTQDWNPTNRPDRTGEEEQLDPGMPPTSATLSALAESAVTGNGSMANINALAEVYQKNGKTEFFEYQKKQYDQAKTQAAKQEIYDRVARRAKSMPVQIDLMDPATQRDVEDVLTDFGDNPTVEILQQRLVDYASKQPTTNLNELSIQRYVASSVIERSKSIARINEEMTKALAATGTNFGKMLKKDIAEVGGRKRSWWSIDWLEYLKQGVLALGFATPGHDEARAYVLADALGAPEGVFDRKTGLSGSQYQFLREWFVNLPPEERLATIRRFNNFVKSNPGTWGDIYIIDSRLSIFNEDTIFRSDPNDAFDYFARQIGSIANYTAMLAPADLLSAAARLIRRGVPHTVVNAVNKGASKRLLATLEAAMSNSPILSKFGVTKVDIAGTQLPRPAMSKAIDSPDGVADAAEHIIQVRTALGEALTDTRLNLFEPQEQLKAIERQAQILEDTYGGTLRVGRSGLHVLDDGTGVRVDAVIGSSDTHGFASIDDARKYAETLSPDFASIKILEADPSGELKAVAAGNGVKGAANRTGEFYVQNEQLYMFRPEDKLIFGNDIVAGPSWMGRFSNYFLTPSAILDKTIYSKGYRAFLSEGVINQRMEQLIAPFFKNLSWKEQREAGQMWEWTADFGKREKRYPTWTELRDAFPDANDRSLLGWYYVRNYWDTVYHTTNDKLYKSFASQGYKTIYGGDMAYHGAPLTEKQLGRYKKGGRYTLYDPVSKDQKLLTKKELTDLYARGGRVIKTPIPISVGDDGRRATLIMFDPAQSAVRYGELSKYPLKWTPGYTTRFYKEPIFIRKEEMAASIDGIVGRHTSAVMTAPDRATADGVIQKLMAERKDDTVRYYVDDVDPRLADRDRVARDLEAMQLDGRIFYDTRLEKPIPSASGGRSEVVDPINAMRRVTRTLGRQMATEDLIRNMKTQFQQQFGYLLPQKVNQATSEEISVALAGALKSTVGPNAKVVNEAAQLWKYIRVMEGSLMGGGVEARRLAVRGAEFLQRTLFPKGSKAGAILVQKADKFAPVEWMKSLAFFDFMTTAPIRQLILQGSQHIFLSPLDARYIGRWQRDTFLLMSGSRADNLRLAGMSKEAKFLRTRNAKMMGISVKEYDELVSRFDRSGLKQAVNMHTFASDVLKIPENVPETVLGRAAQVAGNTATAKPVRGALNKYGFQAGEGFNVAASYMMAVRRRMKERKITDITKLTEDDWAHIQVRGSDYALAMHRANASQYQYGLLSLPMQFLSFTHKVFLTFLRAMPEKLGGTLGNKGFTKAEARKLLAGQFLLFGGAGFGVKDWTEKKLTDMGLDKYAGGAVVDLLSGGMLDMVLDASLQKVVDDPELDLPFDEFLAPGANIINVMRSFYEAGAEKAPVETLLGPSATTTSRLLEAAAYGFMLYDADETKWTTEEKLSMILDASLAGMATGYNNYLKGRLAWETGVMLSQSGVPHNYHATHAEAVAKGLIGINSSGAKDLWEMTKDIREKEKDLTEIAQTFHQRVLNLTQMYAGESTWSKEYFQNRLAMEKSLLQSLPPEERAFVLQKVREMEASRQPDKQGIADYIVQAVSKNIPTATEWLIYRMRESNAIDPEDLPALEELVRSSGKELAEAGEKMDLSLQQDKTTLDGLDDVPEIPLDFNRGTVTFGDRRSQEGGTQPPPPRASTAPSLSQQDREALAAKAKALPFGDLEGRAAIARQLGASEDDIQRILSKAPRSSK